MCGPCMALGSPTRLKHDFRRELAPSCAVTGTIPSFLKSLRVDQKKPVYIKEKHGGFNLCYYKREDNVRASN